MHEDELKRELEQLAARLNRIEQRLGLAPLPPPPPVRASERLDVHASAPPTIPVPPPLTHAPESPVSASKQVFAAPLPPLSIPVPPKSAPPAVAAASISTPTDARVTDLRSVPRRSNATSLEVAIGGKLMAWIGALTILIAVGFAIMVGVQRGWWGQLAPEFRCLIIAAFGAMLLIGGEISQRRLGKAASVGLFSAGLGTLYMDAFATFRYFNLLSSHWAFMLMAAVAIIGFAITLRTRFLTIGVLSILGGYLTPILLRGQSGHDVELLSFLTMLYAISLGLSAVLARDFRTLRYVALGGQILLGGMWIIGNAGSQWMLAVFFAGVWWLMTVVESLWAALRRQTPIGNVAMAVLATAAFVVGGCWVLKLGPATPGFATGTTGAGLTNLVVANWLGIFTFMVALLSGVVAWQYGPDVRELRNPLRTAMEKFAVAMWGQMGVLVVVAVGLQFRGFAQSIGWLTIALVAIEIGRRIPARGITIFGLLVGGLGLVRVATFDWWVMPNMRVALWTFGDVEISRWSILALVSIIATHFAAHRVWMPSASARDYWAATLAVIGTLGWLIVCSVQISGLSATSGWLLGAALLLAFSHISNIGRRQAYLEIALFVIVLSIARWLLLDALRARLDMTWRPADMLPLLNPQVAVALAIGALAWWTHRIVQARSAEDSTASPVPKRLATMGLRLQALAFIFALIVLSFEIDRTIARTLPLPAWLGVWDSAQVLALLLTALWGAGGLALVRIGQLRKTHFISAVGFVLLAGSAIAWLSYDTLLWRLQEGVVNATVIFNLQFIVGAFLAGLLAMAAFWLKCDQSRDSAVIENVRVAVPVSLALAGAIGLLAGSLEIDRALVHDPMLRQVGWSVYWGVYGVSLVVIGFMRRTSAVRYAGLGLLAVVACKVMLIDFAYLEDLPRVISTLAAGLLFVGTSMLYFKLSPRLQGTS